MRRLAESWHVLDNELYEAIDSLLMLSLELLFCVVCFVFVRVCKSFAFVTGPRSIQYFIIRHALARARDS